MSPVGSVVSISVSSAVSRHKHVQNKCFVYMNHNGSLSSGLTSSIVSDVPIWILSLVCLVVLQEQQSRKTAFLWALRKK